MKKKNAWRYLVVSFSMDVPGSIAFYCVYFFFTGLWLCLFIGLILFHIQGRPDCYSSLSHWLGFLVSLLFICGSSSGAFSLRCLVTFNHNWSNAV